ncbi:hypothetical protein LTR27_001829 [Elasticomyces elasticus]|nr:hypothetical protein LTR27_001829 [Elasticomyces elasticus]
MQVLGANNGFAREPPQHTEPMPDPDDNAPQSQQHETNLVNAYNVPATNIQHGRFICDWCSETFTERRTLTRHEAYGTKQCPRKRRCTRIFARPDTRKRHEAEKHYGKKRPALAPHRMPPDPIAHTNTSGPGFSVATGSNAHYRSSELRDGYRGADSREPALLTTPLPRICENVGRPLFKMAIDPFQLTVAEPMTLKAPSNSFRAAGPADDDPEVPSTMMSPFWTRLIELDVFQPILPWWQNLSPAPQIEEHCDLGGNGTISLFLEDLHYCSGLSNSIKPKVMLMYVRFWIEKLWVSILRGRWLGHRLGFAQAPSDSIPPKIYTWASSGPGTTSLGCTAPPRSSIFVAVGSTL